MSMLSTPLRILMVRVGAMGDVLHAMPAVAALRAALPDAEIGWTIEPRWASLLHANDAKTRGDAMPLVDHVHAVPARQWSAAPVSRATLRSVRALRAELRAMRYDVAIDLQGSIRSALIARASGAGRVVGSAHPRETPARWLYLQRVRVSATHVVPQAAEIVSGALQMHLQPAPVALPLDEEAEQWCNQFTGKPKLVLLAPTAGWGAKQWPVERFGVVARALAQQGCTVLVNTSPHGFDAVSDAVVSASGGAAFSVPCTLPQLAALLRRTSLVIAGDSGPLHLAAALQVPVVALFGPTDPARTGPWDTSSRVLRHPSSATDHRRHAVTEAGLQKIETAEVLAAAEQLLALRG